MFLCHVCCHSLRPVLNLTLGGGERGVAHLSAFSFPRTSVFWKRCPGVGFGDVHLMAGWLSTNIQLVYPLPGIYRYGHFVVVGVRCSTFLAPSQLASRNYNVPAWIRIDR